MNVSERRLAAIMFTDLVGYSAITQQNESLALTLLDEHYAILREIFPVHGGREVDVAGDGFLVEFSSAVKATQCAIEIQQQLTKRNAQNPKNPIDIRIGIHMGDILSHGDGVRGDVVNIAARVEPLANPGGICVTRPIYDQIRNKINERFESMGQQRLKNIQVPIEVFRIAWSGDSQAQALTHEQKRIAVLPLRNISPDPTDEYFADGMTDEIIGRLSKIRDLKIISMTSIMKYKNETKSIAEIGRELGVGSILEGSVRKIGDRVRISVQFVDAESEVPEWSQEYDRELKDVFAVQTEISKSVAEKLKVELQSNERELVERRETFDLLAHEYYLQGSWNLQHRTEAGMQNSIEYFQKAIDQDPSYAVAYAGLAESYLMLGFNGFMATKVAYPAAKVSVVRALQLDPKLARARVSLAAIQFLYQWNWEGAARELEQAIEVNPNNAQAYHWYGLLHGALGVLEKATELLLHAKELDPFTLVINGNLGFGYYYSKRYDEAITQYQRVLELEPKYLWAHYYIASCYIQKKSYQTALEHFALEANLWDVRNPALEFGFAFTNELNGQSGALRKLLTEWESPEKSDREVPYLIALSHFHLGELEKGFEWLEEARERKSRGMLFVVCDPILEKIKDDPRYLEFLKSVKLDPESVERILRPE